VWGVSTEPAFIENLYANPAAADAWRSTSGLFGGLIFASNEIDALKVHAEVEQDALPADTWAQAYFGSNYAGGYLLGPELHLLCACDVRGASDALRADDSVKPYVIDHTVFEQVQYSLADLSQLGQEIRRFLDESDLRSNGYGTTIEANVVELFVGPQSTAGLEQEVANRFAGRPVRVTAQPEDVAPTVSKTEPLIFNLVEGGQAMDNSSTGLPLDCTSGFAVQGGYGPFILSAGHCGYAGNSWYQGGSQVGVQTSRNFGGYFDGSLITTYGYRNNYGHFHWNANYYGESISFVQNSNNIVGQSICQTGYKQTGLDGFNTTCGTTTQNNYTPPYGDTPFQPVMLLSNYGTIGGDSGAAVVWPTALYGWGAVGVHSGGNSTVGVDSRLDYILWIWGIQLTPP